MPEWFQLYSAPGKAISEGDVDFGERYPDWDSEEVVTLMENLPSHDRRHQDTTTRDRGR